jgi:hypothetical protein
MPDVFFMGDLLAGFNPPVGVIVTQEDAPCKSNLWRDRQLPDFVALLSPKSLSISVCSIPTVAGLPTGYQQSSIC